MTNCTKNGSCISCILAGYCLRMESRAVTKSEMKNIAFINDALRFAYKLNSRPAKETLGFELDFKPAEWKLFIHEAYTSYRGRILGESGYEQFLDTELLEVPDVSFGESTKKLSKEFEKIRDFFDDYFCNPRVISKRSNLKGVTLERLRIVFSVLRARYPESYFWGLEGKAANDNKILAANDNTPQE